MCRGMLWCFVLTLTLVDISPHTKLTALGKSHDVTLHHSLIEGINFQEWGGEGDVAAGAPEGVALRPAALHFGPAALAAPHVRSVTLTNTGNATLHLASVAGTTPDFHASFFESKTLAPRSNTTFSVVYLGRRAGPVAAHLYIHTSLGVYKYPVTAMGVASEYELWPLVGVRVPANASVEPVLTLHNPTDHVIQVTEVYSSGAWVGLQLPAGGASAPRAAWAVPPRASRDIVRLRLSPPPAPAPAPAPAEEDEEQRPLTAYVRVKANVPGGALVVCVEARAAPAGEHAEPLHLHMRARGSQDPAYTVRLRAGNSARGAVRLQAAVRGARCVPEPRAAPEPCEPPHALAHNGGAAEGAAGARLALLRPDLPPLHDFIDVADLTLDYGELWASAEGAGAGEGAVRCAGCVRLGRAALPYSLRLVPGTLRLDPEAMHFVRSSGGGALRTVSLRGRNTSPLPLHVTAISLSADAAHYFQVTEAGPRVIAAGRSAALARLELLPAALRDNVTLAGALTLRTNLSHYDVPLLVYSGRFVLEWEWPWGAEGAEGAAAEGAAGAVSLGALGTSASRRVGVRLRNPAPAPLCARELAAELSAGSAQLTLAACPAAPPDHPCRCVEGGGWAQAWLVVVAPARAGELRGHVSVRSQHASTDATLSLRALPGRLHAPPLRLPDAAPFAWAAAELVLESTMELEMFVTNVTQPVADPALLYIAPAGGRAAVRAGRRAAGGVRYAPERRCLPDCYTGLDLDSPEGRAWRARLAASGEAAVAEDVALAARRLAAFQRLQQRQPAPTNLSLLVHTSEVVQIPVSGSVRLHWPRVAAAAAGAEGVLAAVGATRSLRVSARNPSGSHALLLQPVLAGDLRLPTMAGGEERCGNGSCVWAPHAFRLAGWRAVRGEAREWAPEGGGGAGTLLLAPHAHVDLTLTFAPQRAALLAAYLYLRNNLTIVEGVLVRAEGAHPTFELAGRKPGSAAPILLEVNECGEASGAGVRRSVVVRNTGRVPVRLREWRVAGSPCQARGFRLQPCAPLALAPNESRALHLAFAPDFTLARAAARLQLRSERGRADFLLRAAVPARLLPRCAAALPRPPWEPALRRPAALLALAALLLLLGAASFDAERLLRRARASRAAPPPRAPLDLRLAAPPHHHRPAPPVPQPPRAPPPARRRRPARRLLPPLDPLAERRAFERWRAEVLRRADDEESRSSEDTDSVCVDAEPPPAPAPQRGADTPPGLEEYAPEPGREDDEDAPSNSADDECISTGSEESSPASVEPEESEAAADRDSPPLQPRSSPAPPRALPPDTSADTSPRPSRAPRRPEPPRPADENAPAHIKTVKQHIRKEKSVKRRAERPSAPPSRGSPAPVEVEVAGVGAGAAASGALRWGASWSSVVAARALAPIGSDVPRRAPPASAAPPAAGAGAGLAAAAATGAGEAPGGDNSLFYFNGAASAPRPELAWRPPAMEPPYRPPPRDYLGETSDVGSVGSVGGVGPVGSVGPVGGVGPVGSVGVLGRAYSSFEAGGGWGGAWAWGAAGAVRPPPGFSAPPRPPRAYDPFRSLASIWAPGAADWRYEPADAPAAPPGEPDER